MEEVNGLEMSIRGACDRRDPVVEVAKVRIDFAMSEEGAIQVGRLIGDVVREMAGPDWSLMVDVAGLKPILKS